jgi:hypothetical protein
VCKSNPNHHNPTLNQHSTNTQPTPNPQKTTIFNMATPGAKGIATTNEVIESAVIRAPLSHVWHFVKLPDFHKFWSAIEKADHVKGTSSDTDVVRWTFKDGSAVDVKQDEHSVSFGRLTRHRT